ncbi:hypothetical protein F2Q69_00046036 [Brassica cretica]|uniref:Uncharacterized protein n=1 Tax=Brassica cretica TaxID=69181 RepID=A0A8S9PLC5_BRACR|nr:hypothetical protein F2Q69_00046036 [Brassica cretica]
MPVLLKSGQSASREEAVEEMKDCRSMKQHWFRSTVIPKYGLSDKGASRQTTNSSQTNDSNNNFWTGPITRARAKAQQETIGHLANLVRPKEKEETERKEEPACWFNVFSIACLVLVFSLLSLRTLNFHVREVPSARSASSLSGHPDNHTIQEILAVKLIRDAP